MRKPILLFLIIMLVLPRLVSAAIDTDLRIKYGTAAGAQRLEFENAAGHGSNNSGTNAQVEVVLGPHRDSTVRFMLAIGLFYRHHQGEIQDLSIPLKVDYSVTGMSIAPGVRIKNDDAWTYEGKLEIGAGTTGKVTLDSPGVDWNTMKKGGYGSLSLILGSYYLFKDSPNRVGLEVGMQKFYGDFGIRSNKGYWTYTNVSGEDVTVNIVYGFQF